MKQERGFAAGPITNPWNAQFGIIRVRRRQGDVRQFAGRLRKARI